MRNVTYNAGAFEGIDKAAAMTDPEYAVRFLDHFLQDNTAAATQYTQTVGDGGTNALTTVVGGEFNFITGASATHECELQVMGAPVQMTLASKKRVGLEVRANIVTLTDLGVFIGLAEPGVAAQNFQTDTTMALANKDYVGFHINAATPTEIDCVYRLADATAVEVKGAAFTSDAAYHTYGINFDGDTGLLFFVDGDLVAKATLAAANFPTAQALAPVVAIKSGAAAGAKSILVDYIDVVGVL